MVKAQPYCNFTRLNSDYLVPIINKMSSASFARLKQTTRGMMRMAEKQCHHIGVPTGKQLIFAYDNKRGSHTYKKMIIKIGKTCLEEGKKKPKFFRRTMQTDLSFLSGFSFDSVLVDNEAAKNTQGDLDATPEELDTAVKFLKSRKWRDHNFIIGDKSPLRFMEATRPESASFNELPASMHPSVKLISLFPYDKEAFKNWENQTCQGVRYIRIMGTRMNKRSMLETFGSLFDTWKKGKHGKVKIVEFERFAEGREVDDFNQARTLEPLRSVAKIIKEYLKGKPKYRTVEEERLIEKRSKAKLQHAAARYDITLNGRNLVLASHRYSYRKWNDYGSNYIISLRVYLDYDGPIPLAQTSVEKCMELMTTEMSLAK